MKLAMAQMRMDSMEESNLNKTLYFMEEAKRAGADLIFFPELQLSPFFPQYEKRNADAYLQKPEDPAVQEIQRACRALGLYASPNIYLSLDWKSYDASLFINSEGKIEGISKMVHIFQAENFYERDYYTPSLDGFCVYDTPFGKIGIVICFDRHIPTGIRACAKRGAELILIPTANLLSEPMELFEWEIRVQAFQNLSYIAMCNRVGGEDRLVFSGESLVASPDGGIVYKADEKEQLCLIDIPLWKVNSEREKRNWLQFD